LAGLTPLLLPPQLQIPPNQLVQVIVQHAVQVADLDARAPSPSECAPSGQERRERLEATGLAKLLILRARRCHFQNNAFHFGNP